MANLVQLTIEGISHAQAGRVKEAEERFKLLVQLSPNPTARILLASLLPPIYQSMEDLRSWRKRLEEEISQLVRQGVRHDVTDSYAVPEFFAQYQGLDDRTLQDLRSKLYSAPQNPQWGQKRVRVRAERRRVGIISKYLRDHTIGRLAQGLAAQLPRGDFHLTLLSVAPGRDEVAEFFRTHCDQFLAVPNNLSQARALITGLKLV
jgi:predicted O-linked N-acetylglucosamine transferase (SPINDLY family)